MPDTQKSEAYRITREYWRLQVQERGIGSVIDEIDGLLKVFRQWSVETEATLNVLFLRQEVNDLAWEIENDK